MKAGAVGRNERSQRSCRKPLIKVGDYGRSTSGRKRGRTLTLVLQVLDLSDGAGCESEGANGSELSLSLDFRSICPGD